MARDYEQTSLWEFMYEQKKITKPLRLIELFAGIGAQKKACELLGIEHESYRICEWAVNSILMYDAIHHDTHPDYSVGKTKEEMVERIKGVSQNYNEPIPFDKLQSKPIEWIKRVYNACENTHNLINIMDAKGTDLGIADTDKYEYLLTYSFPCVDLSLAGLRKGMSKSQKEGGTRSGLLWEVERLLTELYEAHKPLPQLLLMENVPEVIGAKNLADFEKWELKLSSMGYKNEIKILNGKDYAIPQNRRRCFMVSMLGDYSYTFPREFKLKYRLKNFLERKVDERYYLSDEQVERISNWKAQQDPLKDIEKEKPICPTITARGAGEEHSGMILTSEPIEITTADESYNPTETDVAFCLKTAEKGIHPNHKSEGNKVIEKYASNVLKLDNEKDGGGIKIYEATKQGYAVAHDGDGVYVSNLTGKRGTVQKGTIQTLKTGLDVGVVVKDETKWQK